MVGSDSEQKGDKQNYNFHISKGLNEIFQSIHDYSQFNTPKGPIEREQMGQDLKKVVFNLLYFTLFKNGELLSEFSPHLDHSNIPPDLQSILPDNDNFRNYDLSIEKLKNNKNKSTFYNHIGRNCGRKFKPGEPIYRCQECGYDDTCVLCVHCFNPDDHVDHHVYTNICTRVSSGICDCGDSEAWNNPLHCKAELACNQKKNACMYNLDYNSLIPHFKYVLTESLDYFIDVFNQNIEPIPIFTKEIMLKLRNYVQKGNLVERAQFLKDLAYKNDYLLKKQQATDNESDMIKEPKNYAVIVYNDEFHNYRQATSALRQGEPDDKRIELITSHIDGEGRAILKCSTDLSSVIGGYFSVQTNGLSATLTSWSEYIHQETCKYIIKWIQECLSIPNVEFQNAYREALGFVFTEELPNGCIKSSSNVAEVVDKYFANNCGIEVLDPECRYADLSILDRGTRLPLGHHLKMNENNLASISPEISSLSKVKPNYFNSRLQLMLFLDNRYWKVLRSSVQDIIIPTLSSSLKYKAVFCRQFSQIFTHMLNAVCFLDREPQLTALRESVLQLFSCTTSAEDMLADGSFLDVLWSVNRIFMKFSVLDNGSLLWKIVSIANPSKGFSVSFKQGLYAIETLLNKVTDPNSILRPQEFIAITSLCQLFNGAWKIKHKEGEHVLREDQSFIPYLEYTSSIYSIIQSVNRILENGKVDEAKLLNAIHLLYTYFTHKNLPYKLVGDSFEIIKFKVSKQRVAFMNPVHTFFSFLVERSQIAKVLPVIESRDKDFLVVSDFCLRSVVLCSQIDIGFWVRNGISVLHQSCYYKKNPEMSSYSRDIHVNQLSFLVEKNELEKIIYNMLDRWEILDWFLGEQSIKETVYEDKINQLLQQFITFIYQLLSERQQFMKFNSTEEKELLHIKNSIIYNLYTQPLPYSKLLESIPDYLTESTSKFDICLEEVSLYVEPKGLEDNGVFKLKRAMFNKIDPLRLLNMDNDFEHSANIIKQQVSKDKKNIEKTIIEPRLEAYDKLEKGSETLGNFTRTNLFAKIIYKLLAVCVTDKNSAFLYELLHLVHGIMIDDEYIHGTQSFPQAYLDKPICNYLLMITQETSFSSNIINKADYLLERMLRKKREQVIDSLTTCFGADYVRDYMQGKKTQSASQEETEKERKKRSAKERQQKLLQKFARQHSKFMKENESLFSNDEKLHGGITKGANHKISIDEESNLVNDREDVTCSLCQDSVSFNDVFVIPIYQSNTPVIRQQTHRGNENVSEWCGFVNHENAPTFYNYNNSGTKPKKNNGNVMVSCNHQIHFKCLKKYLKKKKYSPKLFICPLCQTISNSFLPLSLPIFDGRKSDVWFNMIVNEVSSNVRNITYVPTMKATQRIYDLLDMIMNKVKFYDSKYFNAEIRDSSIVYILSAHFANTISMLEVASRASSAPYQDLLKGRDQIFKTLKYMLRCISFLKEAYIDISNVHIPYSHHKYSSFPNKPFQYIVRELLFSGNSLKFILNSVLKRIIGHALDYTDKVNINEMVTEMKKSNIYYEPTAEFVEHFANFKDVTDTKLQAVAYTFTLKQICCVLRKCLIFCKVLNMAVGNENNGEVINGFDLSNSVEYNGSLEGYVNYLVKILTKEETMFDLVKSEDFCTHKLREDVDQSGKPRTSISNTVICERGKCKICDYELSPITKGEYAGTVKLVDLASHLNKYITDIKSLKFRNVSNPTHNASQNSANGADIFSVINGMLGNVVHNHLNGTPIVMVDNGDGSIEIESSHASNETRLDFEICLSCGEKIYYTADNYSIFKHLSKCFGAFGLYLVPSDNEICLSLNTPQCFVKISAPYLNSHGESGKEAMKRGDIAVLSLKRYEHLNNLWMCNGIPGYISRIMGDEFRILIATQAVRFNRNILFFRGLYEGEENDEEDDFGFGDDDDDNDNDESGGTERIGGSQTTGDGTESDRLASEELDTFDPGVTLEDLATFSDEDPYYRYISGDDYADYDDDDDDDDDADDDDEDDDDEDDDEDDGDDDDEHDDDDDEDVDHDDDESGNSDDNEDGNYQGSYINSENQRNVENQDVTIRRNGSDNALDVRNASAVGPWLESTSGSDLNNELIPSDEDLISLTRWFLSQGTSAPDIQGMVFDSLLRQDSENHDSNTDDLSGQIEWPRDNIS
ncbi:related to E3 ubiquitin-protein ligase UBR1 [Saccharomycodes ludwigii]|uniref:E3 ubiquitin-protein ligase n=1 Tax=Saccharomycodes ludwigii TaxID=36035 RepID=A0A376B2W9_9ASCO|nr:related to E3 ubiquitin-protein ligase UBR1 [Saccharomycodes ludwigii]